MLSIAFLISQLNNEKKLNIPHRMLIFLFHVIKQDMAISFAVKFFGRQYYFKSIYV